MRSWVSGVMGFPMAGHLARAGHAVTVYNRTAARAEKWLAGVSDPKCGCAPTPAAAAADATLVMMCVGNDDDVRAVALGPQGAVAAMKPGSILVDHTTASAAVAREVHRAASARGIGFLDAPVSGGQAGAENGKLTIMVGGDADTFAAAEPVLATYAKAVTLMGGPGSGPAHQDGQPDLHCRAGPGAFRGYQLRRARRARCRKGARRHRQGRRAIVADGQPRQDHGGRSVRLRLRRRLDAQGPFDLPRRSTLPTARRCPSPRSWISSMRESRRRAVPDGTLRASFACYGNGRRRVFDGDFEVISAVLASISVAEQYFSLESFTARSTCARLRPWPRMR